jgi:hypothetical protein
MEFLNKIKKTSPLYKEAYYYANYHNLNEKEKIKNFEELDIYKKAS